MLLLNKKFRTKYKKYLLNLRKLMYKYLSNHTSPSSTFQNTCQLKNLYSTNMRCVTPVIINRRTHKTSTNFMTKKSTEAVMPKYLSKSKHPLQKQNLLYEISKQNKKLKQQHLRGKQLIKKLQLKQNIQQRKKLSLKKLHQMKQIEFLSNDLGQKQMSKSGYGQINSYLKNSQSLLNFKNSIINKLQKLTQQYDENQVKISQLKQSKKYTRFLENKEQMGIFVSELQNMIKYKKRLNNQIIKLKRIHKQNKRQKVAQLMMQGQIQDSIQKQNLNIYNNIQDINEQLYETKQKSRQLQYKKKKLLNQIQEMKQRYGIEQQVIERFYETRYGYVNNNTTSNSRLKAMNSSNRLMTLVNSKEKSSNYYNSYSQKQEFDAANCSSKKKLPALATANTSHKPTLMSQTSNHHSQQQQQSQQQQNPNNNACLQHQQFFLSTKSQAKPLKNDQQVDVQLQQQLQIQLSQQKNKKQSQKLLKDLASLQRKYFAHQQSQEQEQYEESQQQQMQQSQQQSYKQQKQHLSQQQQTYQKQTQKNQYQEQSQLQRYDGNYHV